MKDFKFTCFIIGDSNLVIRCSEYLLKTQNIIYGICSTNSSIEDWANNNSIPFLKFTYTKKGIDGIYNFLKTKKFDFLFSIVNYAVLPEEIIMMPEKYSINYHDALLPRYAGIHATSWAIINQEKEHGVTWHIISGGIDDGPILKQNKVLIESDETALSLNIKCYKNGYGSFIELIEDIKNDRLNPISQDLKKYEYYPMFKRPENGCIISWKNSSEKIDSLIRALNFGHNDNPIGLAKIKINNSILIIKDIEILKNKSDKPAGTVIEINSEKIIISTATTDILIKKLYSMHGIEVPFSYLINEMKLSRDFELSESDENEKFNIGDLYNNACKYESHWNHIFSNFNPLHITVFNKSGSPAEKEIGLADKIDDVPKNLVKFLSAGNVDKISNFIGIFGAFLSKLTGENYFNIGYRPYSDGHNDKFVHDIFSNILPLVINLNDSQVFNDFIIDIKKQINKSRKSKVFIHDIVMRYQALNKICIPDDKIEFPIVICEEDEGEIENGLIGGSEITIKINFKKLKWTWCYNKNYFNDDEIETIISYFQNYLKSHMSNPERKLNNLSLLTQKQEKELIVDFNNTKIEHPSNITIIDLFEEQVKKNPDKIAAVFRDKEYTYLELHGKVTGLAYYLYNEKNVFRRIVGLFLDRSIDMLIGILAVLKAGGIYLPLDPDFPADRNSYMIDDAGCSLLLTHSHLENRLSNLSADIVNLDYKLAGIGSSKVSFFRNEKILPDDLAYIIYTSGSTGKPKGVQIYHKGLVNVLCHAKNKPGFNENDYLLALATICFDIATAELLLPLISGGTVEIVESDIVKDGIRLKEKIENCKATIIQATPATWQMLFESGWNDNDFKNKNNLRKMKIFSTGEALGNELSQKLLTIGSEVWNLYGPTEITIWSSISQIKKDKKVHIGRPISNTTYYILDKNLQTVPWGCTGELYIGGLGLSRGYLNRDELTKERFIPDHFSSNPEDRLYKTGDIARYLPDKNVEYLGRIDHQVKLKGFRIELEEIEESLKHIDNIKNSVVVLRDGLNNQKQLSAFLILTGNNNVIDQDKIMNQLGKWLPGYMIPSLYVILKEYPLTLSRKINRTLLSSSDIKKINETYGFYKEEKNTGQANNEIKNNLITNIQKEIYEYVRGFINNNSISVDYSAPLGKYGFESIAFTQLSMKINKKFDISINPTHFYQYPAINAISDFIYMNNTKKINEYYKIDAELDMIDNSISEEIQQTVTLSKSNEKEKELDDKTVAIVGIGIKMPGSKNIYEFWDNLVDGKDFITKIPENRKRLLGKTNAEWGGFLDNIEYFDANFFGISPREAELMDPQLRFLLETVWETIENSGHKPSDLSGSNTGVFIGVVGLDYWELHLKNSDIDIYSLSGILQCTKSNRISFTYNLKGPSSTIDTACSSSLVALHRAVNSIRNGECEYALAGGVNLILSPFLNNAIGLSGMISKDGRCKTFDKSADGYVRSEGLGIVLLKPLAKAIEDGDYIYGTIIGSTENHDGRTQSFSAPNPNAQADIIVKSYESANINPYTVNYIETHGTGTPLGDPIEINGIKKAFDLLFKKWPDDNPKNFKCGLGAVKSNIGHLEAAAGITGLIKVLLSMQYKKIPGNMHFKESNPYIDLNNSPFYFINQTEKWESVEISNSIIPRRAGVSSFGFGGSNVHVLLEEYKNKSKPDKPKTPHIIILSAQNKENLKQYIQDILDYLNRFFAYDTETIYTLENLAYTLQVGRTSLSYRLALIVNDKIELINNLRSYLEGKKNIPLLYEFQVDKHIELSGLINEAIEGIEYFTNLIQKLNWEKLAKLWTYGIEIDWKIMHDDHKMQRIPMPNCPFVQEYFWLPQSDIKKDSFDRIQKNDDFSCLFFEKIHEPSFNLSYMQNGNSGIVIVDKNADIYNALRKNLNNEDISLVYTGKPNIFTKKNYIYIDKNNNDEWSSIWDVLSKKKNMPECIVIIGSDNVMTYDNKLMKEQVRHSFYNLFNMVQSHMKLHLNKKLRIFFICQEDHNNIQPVYGALSGWAKSLYNENPNYSLKTVRIQQKNNIRDIEKIIDVIKEEITINESDKVTDIIYDSNNQRFVKTLKRIHSYDYDKESSISFKANDVYIITGGLGKIGRILTTYILNSVKAKIILIGNSKLNAEKKEYMDDLIKSGGCIEYIQADVTKEMEIKETVDQILKKYKMINGIIHAAGNILDSYIYNRDIEQVEPVLFPKILGAINLDETTKHIKLNFFISFSSMSTEIALNGQSEYAYANGFLDYFTEYRNNLKQTGQRYGDTVSINWPYWQDGGMKLSENEIDLRYETTGIAPLPSNKGLQIINNLIKFPLTQLLVLYGSEKKITGSMISGKVVEINTRKHEGDKQIVISKEDLFEKTELLLKEIFSKETKFPVTKLNSKSSFSEIGIDSIFINHFNIKIEKLLGTLPKTLLFEYKNIFELTGHLISYYSERLLDYFGKKEIISDKNISKGNYEENNIGNDQMALSWHKEKNTDKMDRQEDIAIIGIDGRFPHAMNLEEFWNNLVNGKDCIDEIPERRWDVNKYFDPDIKKADQGKMYCKWGGFIDEEDKFDPLFFEISPREAELMDPQERLLLESVWHAVEDAGYTKEKLSNDYEEKSENDVGVFVGVTTHSYNQLGHDEWHKDNWIMPKSFPWSIANRISYFFNFQGPSIPVDSGCSSSLAAIHLACECLKNKECKTAVVGSVNLYFHPSKYISLCQMHMLSPSGKCNSFGESADGFVPGEGVCSVILKPLGESIKDKDNIYAVIKGSSVNHNGKTNGFTVPNSRAQAKLIINTLEKAKIHPETISYFETHGTGTSLGDPIEIAGIDRAFQTYGTPVKNCAIGSLKSNIGHLEAAAGIAGMIKVLLQMKYKKIVSSLNAGSLNSKIDFENSSVYVQRDPTEWKRNVINKNGHDVEIPRRACINSFGAGGTNANLIIEEYEHDSIAGKNGSCQLIILSAKSKDRLREYSKIMASYLSDKKKNNEPEYSLENIAYTLQAGREFMEVRLAYVAHNFEEIIDVFSQFGDGNETIENTYVGYCSRYDDEKERNMEFADKDIDNTDKEELYGKIARIWIDGGTINWNKIHGNGNFRKISLPGYPFIMERFWIKTESDNDVRIKDLLMSLESGEIDADYADDLLNHLYR